MVVKKGAFKDELTHKPKEAFVDEETESAKFEEKPVKMSPKVLETWLNETLQEAEMLDIPGTIANP